MPYTLIPEDRRGWRAGSPPIQFPVTEVEEGRIVYVQSRHRHQEPLHDSFLFHVTDGTQHSQSLQLNITIQVGRSLRSASVFPVMFCIEM